jgi:hypothetical protein
MHSTQPPCLPTTCNNPNPPRLILPLRQNQPPNLQPLTPKSTTHAYVLSLSLGPRPETSGSVKMTIQSSVGVRDRLVLLPFPPRTHLKSLPPFLQLMIMILTLILILIPPLRLSVFAVNLPTHHLSLTPRFSGVNRLRPRSTKRLQPFPHAMARTRSHPKPCNQSRNSSEFRLQTVPGAPNRMVTAWRQASRLPVNRASRPVTPIPSPQKNTNPTGLTATTMKTPNTPNTSPAPFAPAQPPEALPTGD